MSLFIKPKWGAGLESLWLVRCGLFTEPTCSAALMYDGFVLYEVVQQIDLQCWFGAHRSWTGAGCS